MVTLGGPGLPTLPNLPGHRTFDRTSFPSGPHTICTSKGPGTGSLRLSLPVCTPGSVT